MKDPRTIVRLDEDCAALLRIKHGKQGWAKANAWRLRLHKDFDDAFASILLPERADYGWANGFLLKARMEMVKLEGNVQLPLTE
jgi:hypothetical protein